VLECARNLACVGAEPLGLTNCLNFGNPEKPHIAWQLTQAVDGLADACRALGVPVVGGNVSLYNEAPAGPIYPTPVVGMVGKLPDPAMAPPSAFGEEGLAVLLVGAFRPSLQGSELEKLQGTLADGLPELDLQEQARTLQAVRETTRSGLVKAAHDISEGGVAVALAEMAIPAGIGVRADLSGLESNANAPAKDELFGESPGGVLLAVARDAVDEVARLCGEVPVLRIGETGGSAVELTGSTASLSLQVNQARSAYEEAVPGSFE
jgi:phosphoribosylformylglycinamidine synthase